MPRAWMDGSMMINWDGKARDCGQRTPLARRFIRKQEKEQQVRSSIFNSARILWLVSDDSTVSQSGITTAVLATPGRRRCRHLRVRRDKTPERRPTDKASRKPSLAVSTPDSEIHGLYRG